MLTFVMIGLALLLALALFSCFYLWRGRDQAFSQLVEARAEAASMRERARLLEAAFEKEAEGRQAMGLEEFDVETPGLTEGQKTIRRLANDLIRQPY